MSLLHKHSLTEGAPVQYQGFEQVKRTRNFIGPTGQQNATFVEQMAAATEGLRDQVDQLAEGLRGFKT